MKFLKIGAAWLAAAFLSAVGASIASTQGVVNALNGVGADIGIGQRLSMTVADFGILQTLFPVMAVCTLVGFSVAFWCQRFFSGSQTIWYSVAGASSIICTLLLMSWLMNLMPIAGARGVFGMLFIALSGALGGLLFSKLTTSHPHA